MVFLQSRIDNNMSIGGISHTLQPTRPTVQLPGSMIRILPVFSPGVSDVYLASRIHGFSFNVPSHRGRAVSTIMARKGNADETVGYKGSHFDHDFDITIPFEFLPVDIRLVEILIQTHSFQGYK